MKCTKPATVLCEEHNCENCFHGGSWVKTEVAPVQVERLVIRKTWEETLEQKIEDWFKNATDEDLTKMLIECGHPNPYERKPKWWRKLKFWSV